MDVLLLGSDVREVRRSLAGGDVVADEVPAWPDALDGVGPRGTDDRAQLIGDPAHGLRVTIQEAVR